MDWKACLQCALLVSGHQDFTPPRGPSLASVPRKGFDPRPIHLMTNPLFLPNLPTPLTSAMPQEPGSTTLALTDSCLRRNLILASC